MTLIINLFGGPGAGKSTTRAGVFHTLKLVGLNVEEVTEFAKDLTWEKRHVSLGCQAYVFGKQYRNIFRLLGQVDAIITDSPILLSCIYAPASYPKSFRKFVYDMFTQLDSMNYYVRRVKPYNPRGRNQTLSEAMGIDDKVFAFLKRTKIPHKIIDGDRKAATTIAQEVMERCRQAQLSETKAAPCEYCRHKKHASKKCRVMDQLGHGDVTFQRRCPCDNRGDRK
jgi:hypothetical protein